MSERLSKAVLAVVATASLTSLTASERIEAPTLAEPAQDMPVRIDPDRLLAPYIQLPEAVGQLTGAAVTIAGAKAKFTDVPAGKPPYLWRSSPASGSIVNIGPVRALLTAAHVVDSLRGACGEHQVEVDTDGELGNRTARVPLLYQSNARPQPPIGTNIFTFHDGLDAAVLIPKGAQTLLPGQPTPRIQQKVDTPPGTVLFGVNYQPTPDDQRRTPSAEGPLGRPAIYAHIVLGQTATHIVTISDVRSYGKIEDDTQRGGASGGMIVESDADLAAVVSGSLGDLTEAKIEASYPVDVSAGTYNVEVLRKVDIPTAEDMVSDAQSSLTCRHPLDPSVLPK